MCMCKDMMMKMEKKYERSVSFIPRDVASPGIYEARISSVVTAHFIPNFSMNFQFISGCLGHE